MKQNINRLWDRNSRIILIYAAKAFDKFQHPFKIKVPKKRREILQLKKTANLNLNSKPTGNVIQHGKRSEAFPLKLQMR